VTLGIARSSRSLRILDFDVECRPLAWYGGDFVTKQPTVIAWAWTDEPEDIRHAAIGLSDRSSQVLDEEQEMLSAFLDAYEQAGIVTGHYIRGFDLPLLSGASVRLGGSPLSSRLTQDTKQDFYRAGGLSKSMENLGAMFELDHPKIPMNTAKWAEANMLLPHGIALAIERCVGDVAEHLELRQVMMERGVLRGPSEWSPEPSGRTSIYHA
jgi:hypothetical protein